MGGFIQVMSTVADRETAGRIAEKLVSEKLAACVQIAGPVKSVYRWEGKIENADEWQLIVKTRKDFRKKVETAIRSVHPYQVPEIIALPITGGGNDYLKWIHDSTEK